MFPDCAHGVTGIYHLREDNELAASFAGARGKLLDLVEIGVEVAKRAGDLGSGYLHYTERRLAEIMDEIERQEQRLPIFGSQFLLVPTKVRDRIRRIGVRLGRMEHRHGHEFDMKVG